MPMDEPQVYSPVRHAPGSVGGEEPVGGAPGGDTAPHSPGEPADEATGGPAPPAQQAPAGTPLPGPAGGQSTRGAAPAGVAADAMPGEVRHEAPPPDATAVVGVAPEESPVRARIRQLVADLDGIENVPLAEHAERYSAAHAALQAALTDIDNPAGG